MSNPWAAFLQDEGQAVIFQNALRMLAYVDPEKLEKGIQIISRETTMGPLTDPTAYLSGELFDNANQYTKTLKLALPLLKHLKEMKDGQ